MQIINGDDTSLLKGAQIQFSTLSGKIEMLDIDTQKDMYDYLIGLPSENVLKVFVR